MGENLRIIVVEDDKDLRTMLVYGLKSYGIGSVQGVATAAGLYQHLSSTEVDVVVLDLGLPDEDGISVALRLQKTAHLGVIIVSARSLPEDKLLGLQCGADIYFVKPVNIAELAQSIVNLGRRLHSSKMAGLSQQSDPPEIQWKYLPESKSLFTPSGVEIKLTPSECVLLRHLLSTPGQPISRFDILASLGSPEDISALPRLEMILARLRSNRLLKLK